MKDCRGSLGFRILGFRVEGLGFEGSGLRAYFEGLRMYRAYSPEPENPIKPEP